jgi:hypothetical protein
MVLRMNFNDVKDLIPIAETDITGKPGSRKEPQGAEAPNFGAETAALARLAPAIHRTKSAKCLPKSFPQLMLCNK